MGRIKKILLNQELPNRELHNSRMFVDLSENIHIHFRELRLMFSVEEFFEFSSILKEGTKDIKKYLKKNSEYEEQQVFDGIMVGGGAKRQVIPLQESPEPHVSKYFPNRLQIELQEENVIDPIHIHYRDYRLAMNFETFNEFAQGMIKAHENLENHIQRYGFQQKKHPFKKVVEKEEWKNLQMSWFDKIKYKIKRIFGGTETN